MVFGNMGETSGTGVASPATRLPASAGLFGEFLVNAQGEDVVAGIRTPESLSGCGEAPGRLRPARRDFGSLEDHYREMQDIEFTVEEGALSSCRRVPASARRRRRCGSRSR